MLGRRSWDEYRKFRDRIRTNYVKLYDTEIPNVGAVEPGQAIEIRRREDS